MARSRAGAAAPRPRLPHRPRMRRTWPARLLVATSVFLAVGCVSAATGLYYALDKYEQLPRITLSPVLVPEPGSDGNDDPGISRAQNILLVGSDSREGIDPDDPDAGAFLNGEYAGQRTDTIMIMRLDPAVDQIVLLSLNRDLWVDIAGSNSKNRINTAYSRGADVLIQTIAQNFGIPIHHYVEINFVGFKKLVEAVGGVPVYFEYPARDANTGLNIATAGCQTLDPDQALAYARARHYQYLDESGRWRSDPTGDLGRAERQQGFIRAALKRAIVQGFRDPFKLNDIVNAVLDEKFIGVDDAFTASDIIDLGMRFRNLDPNELVSYLLPTVGTTTSAGASVLLVQDEAAAPILDLFRGVTPAPAPATDEPAPTTPGALTAADVSVRVLNGSGEAGMAKTVSDQLAPVGFSVAEPANADRSDYTRSVIRYAPGKQAEASVLASHLSTEPLLEEVSSIANADVVLVVGQDFAGVLAEPTGSGGQQATTTVTTVPLPSTTVVGVAPPADVSCG